MKHFNHVEYTERLITAQQLSQQDYQSLCVSIVSSCKSLVFYSWKAFRFNYPQHLQENHPLRHDLWSLNQSLESSINSNKKINHCIVLLSILVITFHLSSSLKKLLIYPPSSSWILATLMTIRGTSSTHFKTEYKFILDIFKKKHNFLKIRYSVW